MSSMPERSAVLVSNTTPLIALTAALGSLDILKFMYARVVVPFEVAQEVRAGGQTSFGIDAFQAADWLDIQDRPVTLLPFLKKLPGRSRSLGHSDSFEFVVTAGLH